MNPNESSQLTDIVNKQPQNKKNSQNDSKGKIEKLQGINTTAYEFAEDSTEVSSQTLLSQETNRDPNKKLLVNNFLKGGSNGTKKQEHDDYDDDEVEDDDDDEDYIDEDDDDEGDDNEYVDFDDDEEEDEEENEETMAPRKGIIEQNIPSQEVHLEENDSEDEGIEDYRIGGYHPIHIGEVLQGRYVVIQKLGWGHFSTVWLCKDFKYDTYVAVKIQKSAPNYMEAAYDEVEILQNVAKHVDNPEWLKSLKEYFKDEGREEFTREDCHVIQLLNSFIYQGPYGNHFCMVFEIMGVNLLEIIKRYDYKGIPMDMARRMAKQILIGLDYLHRICGLIHTDLKPENILLCLTQDEIKDIVENGQLSKHKEYEHKIKLFQQKFGIKVDQPTTLIPKTKSQKKREREKRKKEKLKESNGQGAHPEATSEDEEEEETKEENPDLKETKKTDIQFKSLKLPDNFRLKIVDLGNACWKHHHFSQEIQTRQYRSPEVIIGVTYNETADIWSFACTIFEMLTGDFLFDPQSNAMFGKDDDHLALVTERIAKIPKKFALSGTRSKKFFTKNAKMKNIQGFHYYPLKNLMIEKYGIKEEEASAFVNFLRPMLEYYPNRRISAQNALSSSWLDMISKADYKLTDDERRRIREEEQLKRLAEKQGGFGVSKGDLRAKLEGKNQDNGYSSHEDLETEDIDSDKEDNDSKASDFEDEPHNNYGYDDLLNNSFGKTGYIPYGGGINVDDLDQDPNWQFVDAE